MVGTEEIDEKSKYFENAKKIMKFIVFDWNEKNPRKITEIWSIVWKIWNKRQFSDQRIKNIAKNKYFKTSEKLNIVEKKIEEKRRQNSENVRRIPSSQEKKTCFFSSKLHKRNSKNDENHEIQWNLSSTTEKSPFPLIKLFNRSFNKWYFFRSKKMCLNQPLNSILVISIAQDRLPQQKYHNALLKSLNDHWMVRFEVL